MQREMTEGGNCRLMAPLIFFRKKATKNPGNRFLNLLEVTTRFELVDEGFGDLALPLGHVVIFSEWDSTVGAADEARTRYLHLGKVALYQMSYGRIFGAFFPAPSRAILANIGAPAKACEARFCGEEEEFQSLLRQSYL